MHALKANTEYKIVTIELAMPANLTYDEIADGLNEILRENCDEKFIADWRFPFHNVWIGPNPEEGEVFENR